MLRKLFDICVAYGWFLLLLTTLPAIGQDPHYSQFYASPMTLNPAMTGLFSGNVRVASTYRNQWQSVSTPFTTASIAADFQVLRTMVNERDLMGFGIMGLMDMSNNRGLKSNYLTASLAYNKTLDYNAFHKLGVGFQATLATKRVDYNRFTFSRQFTPLGFDPSLSNGEPINGFSINYPTFSTGLIYSGMNHNDHQWYFGGSYYHFNRPNEAFSGFESRLPTRTTVHGGYNFPATDVSRIYFSGLYMKSALAEEKTFGFVFESILPNPVYETSIYTGVYYRVADAIVPHVGFNTGRMQVGMSYDINFSRLKTASQGRGGFELTLQMKFREEESRHNLPPCYNKF